MVTKAVTILFYAIDKHKIEEHRTFLYRFSSLLSGSDSQLQSFLEN